MKTITEVRDYFWECHDTFKHLRRSRKRQNAYPCEVRQMFVEFVDSLARDGRISESLADRVTL